MIVSLHTAGAGINKHVFRGAVTRLVQSNPQKFAKYLNFHVSRSWIRSLYQRIKFSRRADTISWPVITHSLWTETKSQFLHDISDKVLFFNIPGELIINGDQTLSKYVATDNVMMVSKGEKHISRTSFKHKRSIILTLCETHNGKILPYLKRKSGRITSKCWFSWRVFLVAKWKTLKQWNWDHSPQWWRSSSVYKKSKRWESFAAGPKKSVDMGFIQGTINNKSWRHPCKLEHQNSHGTKEHDPFATATRSHHKW